MNRIVETRAEAGIRQNELAAELGWHQARLSNYEHGRREASLADSRAIVSAFNRLGVECTLDSVFPDPETEQAA